MNYESEDRPFLGFGEDQPAINQIDSTEPTYRNVSGYADLAAVFATPFDIREKVSAPYAAKYFTPEQRSEARLKLKEIKEQVQSLFADPQIQEHLVNGIDVALELLDPRSRTSIVLRYGLDNPDNKGRTYEQIGQNMPSALNGNEAISRNRAEQIVKKGMRKLHHPARSKHFWPTLMQIPALKNEP